MTGQALAFGCASIAGLYRDVTEAEAHEVLQTAWDLGIRYFDTAPHYGQGKSEHRLGDFLRDKDGWMLSTKVGRLLTPSTAMPELNGFKHPLPFDQRFDFTYDGIMRSVEDSYQRLGLSRIDILYVHDIGDPGAGTDTDFHRRQLLDSGAKALEALKASGAIKSVGLGVNTVEICQELIGRMPIDTILLAGRYTLLDQQAASALFPQCLEHGVEIVIGGVFNSGILATGPIEGAHYNYAPASEKVLERTRAIAAICARHDVALSTAALQFPARTKPVVSTLIGTAKSASLRRNVEQYHTPVPAALWRDLEAAGSFTQ